jgi:hypothetical protein
MELDDQGFLQRFVVNGRHLGLPVCRPAVFVNGKAMVLQTARRSAERLVLPFLGEGYEGTLSFFGQSEGIRGILEIENGDPYDLVRIEVPLPPPPRSTLHIPVGRTFGYAVDEDSPRGRRYGVPCSFRRWQFCAAEIDGCVLSLIGYSKLERVPRHSFGSPWKAGGFADGQALWLQVECLNGAPWELSFDDTLDQAAGRYRRHLEEDYGAIPWRNDPRLPDWFADIKMVVTFDMFRSQGEIAHDYSHLRNLCREMRSMGGGVLFYLPGHHDLYDRRFPFFSPNDMLGGERAFREMIETVHEGGHRVMAHCALWSYDPFQPYSYEFEDLALPWTEEESTPGRHLGPYDASPGMHPQTPVDFDSGELPIQAEAAKGRTVFFSAEVPQAFEAYLTVSGIRNMTGRLKATLHYRELTSKRGEVSESKPYRYKFRFRFQRGVNRVRLDFPDDIPDFEKALFRINDAIYPGPEGASVWGSVWTHPHIKVNITDPRWIATIREDLSALVRRNGVDAIHLDAAAVQTRRDAPIYQELREALPGTLFASEYITELNHFFFHLSQGGSIPDDDRHTWTDLSYKLGEPYTKFYYHLCRAEGFVPVVKVCNHEPRADQLSEELRELSERQWREAPKWHLLPNIRLNYRDFGLDPRTRDAFSEVLGSR